MIFPRPLGSCHPGPSSTQSHIPRARVIKHPEHWSFEPDTYSVEGISAQLCWTIERHYDHIRRHLLVYSLSSQSGITLIVIRCLQTPLSSSLNQEHLALPPLIGTSQARVIEAAPQARSLSPAIDSHSQPTLLNPTQTVET